MINKKYMKEALKEANKALLKDEVPIGCVIVRDNKIIARGFNQKESKNDVTAHAEILAIKKASKKLNNWRLNDCTLYVTLKPCDMCMSAILQSRINNIVIGTDYKSLGSKESHFTTFNDTDINITTGILEDECKIILQDFFKNKRNK